MRRAASRPITKAEVRFTSITRDQSAVSNSSIGLRNWMPALFTRMSTATPCASSAAKAAFTASSSVTSKAEVSTSNPAARIRPAAASSRASFTPFRITRAPAPASPSAKARPSPREDPVIRAVRPDRSNRFSDIS